MIFDLVQDFADALAAMPREHPRHRILKLLDEAIRRDVHFIDRHPTTFFQCMWNTCWWYDCPEAAEHYAPPAEGWPAEGPPWSRLDPRISSVLDAWRRVRDDSKPGIPWVRSLRPPPLHLATQQMTVLPGKRAVFSPDGEWLYIGASNGTIATWNMEQFSRRSLFALQRGAVRDMAVSADGRRIRALVGNQYSNWLYLIDSRSGQFLGPELPCPNRRVTASAFSANCDLAAYSTESTHPHVERILRFCNEQSEMFNIEEISATIVQMAFSPDTSQLAVAYADMSIGVWDLRLRSEVKRWTAHNNAITSLVFFSDGKRVVSGSGDRTIRIWSVESGQELVRLGGSIAWITSLALSADGRQILSGSMNGTLLLWDVGRSDPIAQYRSPAESVHTVALSPNGRQVISGSGSLEVSTIQGVDGSIRIWDRQNVHSPARLQMHEKRIVKVAFSPEGQLVATGSEDRTIRLWDCSTGRCAARLTGHESAVVVLGFSEDGGYLASGSIDGTLCVWDRHQASRRACLRGHRGAIRALELSPDGARLVSVGGDQTVWVWSVATEEHHTVETDTTFTADSAVFSTCANFVAVRGGAFEEIDWVWDARRESMLGYLQHRGTLSIHGRKGALRASVIGDMIDVETPLTRNAIVLQLPNVSCMSFSRDGRFLLAGTSDGVVAIWELSFARGLIGDSVKSSKQVYQRQLIESEIRVIGLSPQGRVLVAAGTDGSIWLKDRVDESLPVWTLESPDEVVGIGFSPDSEKLLVRLQNGLVWTWDLSSGRHLQSIDLRRLKRTPRKRVWVNEIGGAIRVIFDKCEQAIVEYSAEGGFICQEDHPSDFIWAWGAGDHLHLVCLEGDQIDDWP